VILMQVKERPLEEFVAKVVARQPVTFSRWGDGEWYSVFGRDRGQNCDGHRYFPQMGAELKNVLLAKPPYVLGLQGLARRVFDGRIESWIDQNYLNVLDWIDADVFHNASQARTFGPMLEALRSVPLVMVGPPHLSRLKKFLGYREFITVPPKNSYISRDHLLREVKAATESLPVGSVVSFSAGMPAKLLIHEMHAWAGQRLSLIDFGSVWDPYAGVKSRKYMRDMTVEVPDDVG